MFTVKKNRIRWGAALFLFLLLLSGCGGEELAGEPVASEREYAQEVSMTEVEVEREGGDLILPLDLVEESGIVTFEVEGDYAEAVPVMAYITPTGRLFTGISLCEPCGAETYSLHRDILICGQCSTTYDIETREGLEGSTVCMEHPPLELDHQLTDGKIRIPAEQVTGWQPRL